MEITKKRNLNALETCPICGEQFQSIDGNNPAPLDVKGNVCEKCNLEHVIPARLAELGLSSKKAGDTQPNMDYAVAFNVGDLVCMKYDGQTYSDEVAKIVGYDKNGLYILQWQDDKTYTDGIGDMQIVNANKVEQVKPNNTDPKFVAHDSQEDVDAIDAALKEINEAIKKAKKALPKEEREMRMKFLEASEHLDAFKKSFSGLKSFIRKTGTPEAKKAGDAAPFKIVLRRKK